MGNPILRAGSAAVVASASGTSLTASWPSGSLPGDLILIWNASPDNGITFSAPGFQAVAPAGGTGMSAQLLFREDSGTEPSTYAVTSSAATNAGLIIASYGNVDQFILFDPAASSGQVNSVSGTITPNTMTTLYPNSQLLWLAAVADPQGGGTPVITIPGGFSSQVAQATSSAGSGTNTGIIFADKVSAAIGAHTAPGSSSQNQFSAALLLGLAVANPVGQNLFPISHTWRRGFAPRLRRSRQFFFPAGQGTLPEGRIAARQSIRRRQPQWPRVITRTRLYQPPWGQGTKSQSFPSFTRRSVRQRPGVLFIRRGRFFGPVPGQGTQGVQFPLFTRRRSTQRPAVPYIRRGRFFHPGWPQGAQGFPFNSAYKTQRLRTVVQLGKRSMRGRLSVPLPPQRTQGVHFPLWTRQVPALPLRRFASPRRRPHFFQYLIPHVNWQAQAALTAGGTLTAAAVITEQAAVAMTARSTLAVAATRTVPGSAALSGQGKLAVMALVTETAAASMTGTGTLAAAATVTRVASAAFSGTGTMTVAGQALQAARLTATGTMTTIARITIPAAAALEAEGVLSAQAGTSPATQRITITGNAGATWEEITAGRLMDIREPHVAESHVVTQDLEDGTFDS